MTAQPRIAFGQPAGGSGDDQVQAAIILDGQVIGHAWMLIQMATIPDGQTGPLFEARCVLFTQERTEARGMGFETIDDGVMPDHGWGPGTQ